MTDDSQASLRNATKGRASFSEHGPGKGAAGELDIEDEMVNNDDTLVDAAGETAFISRPDDGFPDILVTLSWERVTLKKERGGLLSNLLKLGPKVTKEPVDLDLGCLYELKDGRRGCLQGFGGLYGALHEAPFIHHEGDDRTGDKSGVDETITINGAKWDEIKRVLVYMYIYKGAPDWRKVRPKIMVDVPGGEDLAMRPHAAKPELVMCAVGTIENIDGHLKLTNHSEYYRGHAEMDRVFGYGLEWEDGAKDA